MNSNQSEEINSDPGLEAFLIVYKTLLESLPHPAMLIKGSDKTVLAVNKTAQDMGVRVGEHCWKDFMQSLFLSEQDQRIANSFPHLVPASFGVKCTFCRGDQCLSECTSLNDPQLEAFGTKWDTYWINCYEDVFLHYAIDITQKAIFEEALIEEKFRIANILEGTHAGTWEWNIQSGEQSINERWAEMIGYTREELSPITIDTFRRFINPEDEPCTTDRIGEVLNKELEFYDTEFRLKHKDGHWVWINGRGKVNVWLPDGRPLIASGTHIDISSLKLAEEKLRQSEAWYRGIFDAENDALFLIDQETGRILDANSSASALYGYAYEELVALKNTDMSAEPDQTQLLTSKAPPMVPLRYHRKKNGTVFPVEVSSSVMVKEVRRILICAIRDISERIRLEDEIKKSHENFKLMFNTNIAPMLMYEVESGKILKSNTAAEKFYGYTKTELEAMFMNQLSTVTANRARANRYKALSGEQDTFEVIHRTKSGENIDVEVHASPISYDGRAILFSSIYDIRERKAREEAIAYISYHDKLTGLYNRRFYEEELKRLDTVRNLPISLIMADMNGLKRVNDTYGHLIGDEILKKAADILKKVCRADDIIARMGGDEFIIILLKTDNKEAEKLTARIDEMSMRTKTGELAFTMSLGFATKTEKKQKISDVYKSAEDLMYSNKVSKSSRQK